MITLKELNPNNVPLTAEQKVYQRQLLGAVNRLRGDYGRPMHVTSGVRSIERQEQIDTLAGRKPRLGSAHIKGAAVDFADPGGLINAFINERGGDAYLLALGLFREAPEYTVAYNADGSARRWAHLQISPPASGKRTFIPYNSLPPQPPKKGQSK